jgi:lipopolysaccharide/colanic/teichoic acid biosynthesis glycosyltransferase
VLGLLLSEILLLFGCYTASAYLFPDLDGQTFMLYESGVTRIAIQVGLLLLGFFFRDLYAELRIRNRTQLLQQLILILGFAFIGQALISYLNKDWRMPPQILIPGSGLALLVIFGWRLLFAVGLQHAVGARRVLFLGASPTVAEIASYMGEHPELGFTAIGYLEQEGARSLPDFAVASLGSMTNMAALIDENHPDWIVVSQRAAIHPAWVDDFLELRFGGVEAADASRLYETTLGRVCVSEIRPTDLVFSKELQPKRLDQNLQSIFSTGIAALTLLIAAPFLPILAVLIKAGSRGPVLLRERRTGLGGSHFTMYRFRCRADAARMERAPAIGRFLRRFGLDALPQMWNVLRGDMSLVGPEPVRPEFAARLDAIIPFFRQPTAVKPGITGWAQINAFRDQPFPDEIRRLEYDLYYIKNFSISLDLFVLVRALRDALVTKN